jgi:hypothetical protein
VQTRRRFMYHGQPGSMASGGSSGARDTERWRGKHSSLNRGVWHRTAPAFAGGVIFGEGVGCETGGRRHEGNSHRNSASSSPFHELLTNVAQRCPKALHIATWRQGALLVDCGAVTLFAPDAFLSPSSARARPAWSPGNLQTHSRLGGRRYYPLQRCRPPSPERVAPHRSVRGQYYPAFWRL